MKYKFDFGDFTITSDTDNDSLAVNIKKFIGSKSISVPKSAFLQAASMLATGKDTVAMVSFIATKDGTYYKFKFDLVNASILMSDKEANSLRSFLLGEGR